MADVNDDGNLDLLVGGLEGNIALYLRADDGELTLDGNLTADDEEIDLGLRTAAEWVDWDLDGDGDIIAGSSAGYLTLFINEGSPQDLSLTDQGRIQADEYDINAGSESAPAFGDLTGDGVRDLVIGSASGTIQLYVNIGENDDPVFSEMVLLQDQRGDLSVRRYSRPDLLDWDNDGDLDLVVGMQQGEIKLFLNPGHDSVKPETSPHPSSFVSITNYPEPFNSSTVLSVRTPTAGTYGWTIHTQFGRTISRGSFRLNSPGVKTIPLDFQHLAAGAYFVTIRDLRSSGLMQKNIRKLTLIK